MHFDKYIIPMKTKGKSWFEDLSDLAKMLIVKTSNIPCNVLFLKIDVKVKTAWP